MVSSLLSFFASIYSFFFTPVFGSCMLADRRQSRGLTHESCLKYFFEPFSTFFVHKRLKTAKKSIFDQLLSAHSTQKLFQIHNSRELYIFTQPYPKELLFNWGSVSSFDLQDNSHRLPPGPVNTSHKIANSPLYYLPSRQIPR